MSVRTSTMPLLPGSGEPTNPVSGVSLTASCDSGARLLPGFDLLLMTANKPTLNAARQYPTTGEIAAAWRDDAGDNVHYFYDNRHYGITTFEDAKIHGLLRGDKEP